MTAIGRPRHEDLCHERTCGRAASTSRFVADRRCCSRSSPTARCSARRTSRNIIVQNSYILILAIGMILIIIAGHIDLSVGSVVALTGAIAAVLMVRHDVPWPLGVLVTLVVGRADRRLAGLLGRLLRHPGVHRHAGRHAAVPRR